MSSELRGGGGDRPDRPADQPGEGGDNPFNKLPRDVNYVPASAGWKPDSGISRADYYSKDGDGPAKGPGTTDTGPRGTAAAPGGGEGTGAVPGAAPGRSEGAGPQPVVPRGQGRENGAPADKTNDAQAARRDPGGDRNTGPVAPPSKTLPGGHDRPQPPDNGDPPAPGAPGHDRGGILHGHSEFHGQNLDLYTDGTRWVGGDAVRAARAEDAKKQADGQPEPVHHGITDIPGMREQGANVVGDKPPDDETELPPDRMVLLEADDSEESRLEGVLDCLEGDEIVEDLHDTLVDQGNTWQQVLDAKPPTQALQYHNQLPHIEATPQQATMGDVIGAVVITSLFAADAGRRIHGMLSRRREAE